MVYPYVKDYPKKLQTNVVRWVIPGWYTAVVQNIAAVAGRLYYWPIFVPETTTYIRIGIQVIAAAAAGSLARLGIYNWNAGLPGRLRLDAGTVATDGVAIVEIVITETLVRGYYFLCAVFDNTPTCEAQMQWYNTFPSHGWSAAFNPTNLIGLQLDGRAGDVAGGLADPAPAPTNSSNTLLAFVQLREN